MALLLVGCGKLFGIEVLPEAEPGSAGGPDESPAGGDDTGGAQPSGVGGGRSNTGGRTTAGGRGAGGTSTAQGGGAAASGGAPAGGPGGHAGTEGGSPSDDGGAGAVGAPPVIFSRAGDPCEPSGAISCVAPRSRQKNLCRDGMWTAQDELCPKGSNCDRRSGACQPIVDECEGKQPGATLCRPFPTDDTIFPSQVTCGPDLVSLEVTDCDLMCNPDSGRCVTPTSNQIYVEKPPAIGASAAAWPRAPIHVCFEPGSDMALRASVREEIESTWGRYSAADFAGWDDCAAEASSVKIRFEPVCTDVLASINRFGYPGPLGNSEVGLCLQYRQGTRAAQSTPELLLRLAARHEFGHVLGFDHSLVGDSLTDFFASVIGLTNLGGMKFHYPHVGRLQWAYGTKPSGSLATYRGKCLDGDLLRSSCAGLSAQRWSLLGAELEHSTSGQCLGTPEAGAAIGLVACASGTVPAPSSAGWRLSHVQVRPFGGLCLEETDFGGNELGVPAAVCKDFNYEKQLFDVEGVANGRKLRLRRGSRCVELDAAVHSPKLKPCDDCALDDPDCDALDRLELTNEGQLALRGNCLQGPTFDWLNSEPEPGQVSIEPCATVPSFRWNLSGVLERDDGEIVTPAEGSGDELFTSGALDASPTSTQVFDYYL